MDDDSTDVGERIKAIRGGMTQQEFADLLGVSRKTITRYEAGSHLPDAEFLIKLNVLYSIQPLWLLTGKGQDVAGERLSPRESRLLAAYRAADAEGRSALESMAALLAARTPTKKKPAKKK